MAFQDALAAGDVPDGSGKMVELNGRPVAVFNLGGQFYAIDDTCTHAEASLADGEVNAAEGTVACPWHGAHFSIKTGEAMTMPAVTPVRKYAVKVEAGRILVDLELAG